MRPGDTVRVQSDTEDAGKVGIYRVDCIIRVGGPRVDTYCIVTFEDGHEGAYDRDELMVIDDV